ncbi:hypothetical protein V7968_28195 [Nocardia vulneris]|uniref:hypothetical protein n=1 Tax=Nocardia vulneris TaxID=1141657 RepID=UPI0030CE3CF1
MPDVVLPAGQDRTTGQGSAFQGEGEIAGDFAAQPNCRDQPSFAEQPLDLGSWQSTTLRDQPNGSDGDARGEIHRDVEDLAETAHRRDGPLGIEYCYRQQVFDGSAVR